MGNRKAMFFIIIMAACLTQFATDIYIPSLPAIAVSLQTHIQLVQFSLAIYLVGVAISQLVYGPISEGLGRKKPLLVGLLIMFVGSVICLFAPTMKILIIGRLIQGLGAGGCSALWRSAFRDLFTGDELAKYGSYLTIFVMFIIPAAPVLGGYLQEYSGWRTNFIFIILYVVVTCITVLFGFKETNHFYQRKRLDRQYVYSTFRQLLTSHLFMGLTTCTLLSYGAFFAWFTTGPVLLIHVVGLSPVTFGWLNCLGAGIAYALAGQLNGRYVHRFGMANMMRFGWIVMIIGGVSLLVGKFVWGVNTWDIIIPIIIFIFGSTFIWPNAFAAAFTPFGHIAGYTGALYGFMQISGGALLGDLMSHLPSTTQVPLAIVIISASVLAWLLYEMIEPATPKIENEG